MPNHIHTHPVLFVKLDGIGDYLFFRLFWPQIAQIAQQKKQDISFLCSDPFLPLVEQYDRTYIKKFFVPADVKKWKKAKFFFFLPRYYKRFLRGKEAHLLWKKKWECVYNMQPLREVLAEEVIGRVQSPQKVSNKSVNSLLAPVSWYKDDIYTDLLSVSLHQFIMSFFKELLEKSLNHPFQMPALQLPFSRDEIEKTVRQQKLGKEYIVFVPFTSNPLKDWPLERFVLLARKIAKQTSLPVVIIGKTQQPHSWADCPHVINLVNKTSLVEAMQLAAGATYAVCSDTSLMHCALLGQAQTICLSCGLAKELFVNYPSWSNVKQKVFFPSVCNEEGIGRMEDITFEPVGEYIQSNWFLSPKAKK